MRHYLFLLSLLVSTTAIAETTMTVYRSPTCSCCSKWISHVKQSGFVVNDNVTDDMDAIKKQHGLPAKLASCHTAMVNGYVIEGHVPAEDIKRLLSTKPAITGISAPGMPMGSPGMETSGVADKYQVMLFDKDGGVGVFGEH
jgi:hypothetical protein